MSAHASMSAAAIELRAIRDQSTTHTLPMLVRLDIALRQAEQSERLFKQADCGEGWYRAWKRALDLREQIALLKSFGGAS